jgi:hypothetical protein
MPSARNLARNGQNRSGPVSRVGSPLAGDFRSLERHSSGAARRDENDNDYENENDGSTRQGASTE